ncbi:MAG: hypothetical protein AAFX10_16465 [Pseudomonadota bacterium]
MPSIVDRFYAAVTVLAGEGRMKHRLLKAYTENLGDIDEDELPVAVREPFADLRSRMRAVAPLHTESRVYASVRKMSKRDAGECSSVVLDIYNELMQQPAAVPVPTPVEDAAEVPAFLVKSAS